eukprot:TRINITY_DN4518_c0_g1_i1.p1 TRINITY_DN4518_c0_g1~~TRINITY_DN4518_c0_g1_i1.p1  ORF type:complete len:201 (-),score=22.45 TRINITY_DN4518_c0_g1_i1:423-1025(-)
MVCCTLRDVKERIKRHIIDILILGVLVVFFILSHEVYEPYNRFFVERDPTLSYPYEIGSEEAVSSVLAGILAIPVPMFLIFLLQIFARFALKVRTIDTRVLDFIHVQLAFLHAIGMAQVIVEFLKGFVGRKRPNFFAMCNYYGYRDALAAMKLNPDNMTHPYWSLTVPGKIGNISNCYETDVVSRMTIIIFFIIIERTNY